jgi:uncharacterized protein YgbK (DUF1537 family)
MRDALPKALETLLHQDDRIVVVLDDDPTGTQTFSDVMVVLRTDTASLQAAVKPDISCFFVLTNTRAMRESDAVKLLRQIKRDIDQACAGIGRSPCYLLRGDSTLRGHIFAEMNVFRQERSVGLLVPAFPECGRTTVNGIHYLTDQAGCRPVAETEFARDTVFGFTSRSLVNWVAEKSSDWQGETLGLEQIRNGGSDAVAVALLSAKPGTVLMPDAEQISDIEIIVEGLLKAEQAGLHVVVRSASTLASIRCGKRSAIVRPKPGSASNGLLIVCGSHTGLTTRQLAQLTAYTGMEPVILPTEELMHSGREAVVADTSNRVIEQLKQQKLAIVASERLRDAKYGDLASGAIVMEALTAVVSAAAAHCSSVVAKGGITSAQVATDGLGAVSARVEGQLEAGVSLWTLQLPSGATMPYAVIPGNVGNENTLVHVYRCFTEAIEAG